MTELGYVEIGGGGGSVEGCPIIVMFGARMKGSPYVMLGGRPAARGPGHHTLRTAEISTDCRKVVKILLH